MEANKKVGNGSTSSYGLGSSWANNWPIESNPFAPMAPSNLPLIPTGRPFQVWKRPYAMSHFDGGASSSGTKAQAQASPSSDVIANKTTPADAVAMKDALRHAKNSSSDSDDSSADAADDNKTVKTTHNANGTQSITGRNVGPECMDPKKLRRIISNRMSAQKSRLKKLQYITEMERKAKALEAQIAVLRPQYEFYKNHKIYLQMEHKAFHNQMSAYAYDKIQKEAEIEANKKEVCKLRQLQQLQMQNPQFQGHTNRLVKHEPIGQGMEQVMNPSSHYPHGRGHMVYSNPNQAQMGATAANMNMPKQVNMQQQHQNQCPHQRQVQQQRAAGRVGTAGNWEGGPKQTEIASPNQSRRKLSRIDMNSDEDEMDDHMLIYDGPQNQDPPHHCFL